MKKALLPLALALSFAATLPAAAAEIILINQDFGLGTGLDDPTPRAPAGGNAGTTLGEQRQVAYFYAAQMWGSMVKSSTPIYVGARFIPQTCTPTSATLGSAGSTTAYYNVPGGVPGVIYGSALTDALYGGDANPGGLDIQSQFNSRINSDPACLGGSDWYYGVDGKTPAGKINFLNVVMHELSHGLGFQSFMNVTTGAQLAGLPDIYLTKSYNNTLAKPFTAMTNAERAFSVRDNGNTVWTGANVTANVPAFLDSRLVMQVPSPVALLVGNRFAGRSSLGPAPTAANFVGTIALANDGVGTTSDACEAIPAGSLAGKVALVDRGTCTFDIKVLNAQAAGAKAVVIANNAAGEIFPGGSSALVTIPVIGVLQADGAVLRSVANVQVRTAFDALLKDGADTAGRVRLNAPAALAPGSTYSHFDIALNPNALMEPSITDTLRGDIDVDLTVALFKDIGWTLEGNAKLGTCDTLVPTVSNDGLAVGAHVRANSAVCDAFSATRAEYMTCTTNNSKKLVAAGLITNTQASKIVLCANQWSATRF